ncbi:MAG: family N-acetyltransferase [Flavipsychrobacter sp.]|nr:family N-acetyltransferase [Flavipsychrobacter sp.]
MTGIVIRNADTGDVTLIRQIAMDVWPQTYVSIIGEAQVTYMLERFYAPEVLMAQMAEQGHRFILCYSDGVPVAFGAWSEVEPRVYKLHKLYIVPGQHGKGIGRSMVAHIVNELQTINARELRLNVNKYNHTAIAFYEKTGFKQLFDEDIDIGCGYFMNDHVLGMDIG